MNKKNLFYCSLLLFFILQCKTLPPVKPKPSIEINSAVVISIVQEHKILFIEQTVTPKLIYVAKLEDPDDPLHKSVLIKKDLKGNLKSSLIKIQTYSNEQGFDELPERFYFLNLDPGLYAIVGYTYTSKNQNEVTKYNVFFTQKDIEKLKFYVKPGKIVILGKINAYLKHKEMMMTKETEQEDPIAYQYGVLIAPEGIKEGLGMEMLKGFFKGLGKKENNIIYYDNNYLIKDVNIQNDAAIKDQFIKAMYKDWKSTPWIDFLNFCKNNNSID
ncbi:MAG: hypothetical protein KatS3mg129_0105 [Leptospiraceae bacterium]|nr:MAG: hypothetical protein KatS3mg129_0105 [Leptospiraceae bacterium]